ncbi:MAG: universal stress protein [Pyrodictiaceae archaeon]
MVYSCIVVGFDGSNASREAVRRALELAKKFSARLSIVTVVPNPLVMLGEYMMPIRLNLAPVVEDAKKRLEGLLRELREISAYDNIGYDVIEGDPAQALVDYARDNKCDLIVVGRRGLRKVERFLIGSVSSRVVSLAHGIDVLVVETIS